MATRICLDHVDKDATIKNMSLPIYKKKLDNKDFQHTENFNFWVFDKDYEHCVCVISLYQQYLNDEDERQENEDKKLVNTIKERN